MEFLKFYKDTATGVFYFNNRTTKPGAFELVKKSATTLNVQFAPGKDYYSEDLTLDHVLDAEDAAIYTSFEDIISKNKDFFVKAPAYDAGAILYGVERLRNSPDPDFIPIGNPFNHMSLPIHNLRKLVKVNFARQIVGVFNQTNINFMEDGSAAILDGSDNSDIVVRNPHMWAVLDGGGSTGQFERWIIGDRPFTYDGDVAIEINEYVDAADNCTLDSSNRLRCVRNETAPFAGSGSVNTAGGLGYPRQNISRYNMEVYAGNRGVKNYGTFYRDHLVEAALMYIEFKTKNLKAIFGSCGTGWTGTQWTDYNGQNAVLKILEAHLTLSGRSDVVSQGHLTGTFIKNFTFATGSGGNINTPFGCYRGKVLRNGLWNHISGIEYEIQSAADGGLSKVWVQFNPDLLDTNRSDAAFNFKNTYTYIGNASRSEGWSKGAIKKAKQPIVVGGAETTYDCQYFWTNIPGSGTSRRCVLEGGPLTHGSTVAFGSSSNTAPSNSSSTIGVGFRADVAG